MGRGAQLALVSPKLNNRAWTQIMQLQGPARIAKPKARTCSGLVENIVCSWCTGRLHASLLTFDDQCFVIHLTWDFRIVVI